MASKMLWLDRYFIVIILLFIGVVSQLSATSLFLQHAKTGDRDFFVNVEERFQVEMVIDPQGQQVTAFEIYLSFSDQYLELIDADPINPGIQPVKQGKALPNGWQIFDNDTHGDPGNKLSNFQIDFSRSRSTAASPGTSGSAQEPVTPQICRKSLWTRRSLVNSG